MLLGHKLANKLYDIEDGRLTMTFQRTQSLEKTMGVIARSHTEVCHSEQYLRDQAELAESKDERELLKAARAIMLEAKAKLYELGVDPDDSYCEWG